MKTLLDVVENSVKLTELLPSAGASFPPGVSPKLKIVVPGEKSIQLPSEQRGFEMLDGMHTPVLGMSGEQSYAARGCLLSKPGAVFALKRPTDEQLVELGLEPAGFRSENPRNLCFAVAIELSEGTLIYGAATIVAVEHGLRMGSTNIVSMREYWTDELDDLEDFLCDVLQDAAESVEARPESGGKNWKTIVALLGGIDDPNRLPVDWQRRMRIAAGLRLVNLEIRPNPEASRAPVIHDLKTLPLDGLLVWIDWVAHPEVFTSVYRSAHPGSPAELLGTRDRSMSFGENLNEMVMHLREFTPLEEVKDERQSYADWDDASVGVLGLVGPHFAITDRARKSLKGNRYPFPQRMFEHLERLADLAYDYRVRAADLGAGVVAFAIANHQIEIALFDNSISVPVIVFEGVDLHPLPHVKVDDAKSPDKCGRIYFAIDSSNLRFVVDHIGLHDYP